MIIAAAAWFISALMFIGVMIYLFKRKRLTAFSLIFYLSILMLVRPVIFLLELDTPLVDGAWRDFWPQTAWATLLGAAWLGIFGTFYYFFINTSGKLGSDFLPAGPAHPPVTAMMLISLIATSVAVIGTMALVMQEGSVARFMVNVKIGKAYAGLYWIREISTTAAILCLYGLLGLRAGRQTLGGVKSLPTGGAVFYGFLILVCLMMNYFWGNRMNIALFSFAALISMHFYVRPFRLYELVLIAVLAAATLQGLRVLRGSFVEEIKGLSNTVLTDTGVRTLSNSYHFTEFDALSLAVRDAGKLFDFRLGADFFNGLLSWLPRSLFPEKETFQIGGWFRRVYEPNKVNGWPVTVIGEWYINFWYAGIFLGAAVSALAAATFDKAYEKISTHAWHAVMAPMFGFFFFTGGVSAGTPQAVFLTIVPIGIVCFVLQSITSIARRKVASRSLRLASY